MTEPGRMAPATKMSRHPLHGSFPIAPRPHFCHYTNPRAATAQRSGRVVLQSIRIRQYSFKLSTPYGQGHQLSLAEAQALNSLRAENIRNNVSKIVLDEVAILAEGQLLSSQKLEYLQQQITEYDLSYQFVTKHTPARRPGQLEIEAKIVATDLVLERCHAKQLSLSDADFQAEVEFLQTTDEVQDKARTRIAARSQIAASAVEDLL